MERNGSERGAGLVEYVLLVAFIAVVSITGVQFVGEATRDGLPQATAAITDEEATAESSTSSTTSALSSTATTSTTVAPAATTTSTTEAPAAGNPKCDKNEKKPKC